jgi:hypothetical protein
MKRFWQIPGIEKILLIKSLFLSLLVSLLVHFLPLKYYLFILKTETKYVEPEHKKPISVKIAFKSLKRASLILPWRYNCMVKSITMKLLLNSLGISSKISLGLIKSDYALLKAHASLKIDNYNDYLKNKSFHEVFTIT